MKYILFLVILFFAISFAFPHTSDTISKVYYNNGNIRSLTLYKNYSYIVKSWFLNGKPDSLCFFQDYYHKRSSFDSTNSWWYENGKIKLKRRYYNQYPSDTAVVEYYPSGNLKYVEYYYEKSKVLLFNQYYLSAYRSVKSWYENGNLDSSCFYKDIYLENYSNDGFYFSFSTAVKDSISTWHYENGTLRKKISYEFYKSEFIYEYYENGSVKNIEFNSISDWGIRSLFFKKEWSNQGLLVSEDFIWNDDNIFRYSIPYNAYSLQNDNEGTIVKYYYLLSDHYPAQTLAYKMINDTIVWIDSSRKEEIINYKKDVVKYKKSPVKIKFDSFVKIPSGSFNSFNSSCNPVSINSFYIQKTEVTNKQYRDFFNEICHDSAWVLGGDYLFGELRPVVDSTHKILLINGEKISLYKYFYDQKYDNYPVVGVDYYAILYYCQWLFNKVKKQLDEKIPPEYISVRLPTKAEWEYAATEGKGIESYIKKNPSILSNYNFRYKDTYTHVSPSSAFKANSFGLRNMFGNVWEWCLDSYVKDNKVPLIKSPLYNQFYMNVNINEMIIMGGSFNDSLELITKGFHDFNFRDSVTYGRRNSLPISMDADEYIKMIELNNREEQNEEGCLKYKLTPEIEFPFSMGFRPVIIIADPKMIYGVFNGCEWYEFNLE